MKNIKNNNHYYTNKHNEDDNIQNENNEINYILTKQNNASFFIQRKLIIEYSFTPTHNNLLYLNDNKLTFIYNKFINNEGSVSDDRIKKVNDLLLIKKHILLTYEEIIEIIPGYFYNNCLNIEQAHNIYDINEEINKENWFVFINVIDKLPYGSIPLKICRISSVYCNDEE